jgi:hypothetical protein
MIDATHDTARGQHPDGRHPIFTLPRPGWADEIHIGQNLNGAVVMHSWTATTVARGGVFAGEVEAPLEVQVLQIDDLEVDEDAVSYKTGRPHIFLAESDVELTTVEARRYATGIVEACDRLDGVAGAAGCSCGWSGDAEAADDHPCGFDATQGGQR